MSFYKQTTLPDLISKEKLPPLPQKIGPYKVEGLLNKGGMSLLYIGVDPNTNQTLVIKVLSPSFVTHPEATQHFLKEAQIIGIASHPNIIKLYGQGEWEGGLYIAMEFIRGVSLSQFIAEQSFSLKRCIDIILQVAYALLHLHTHGIIHRDLKPENILINEEGEIKVIDFGIAQLYEENKTSSAKTTLLGTPSYMSPEQRENSAKATYASDIYSLGVIAYELLIGKLSFGMVNLSLLSPTLQKILGKALAVSLRERYKDIVDLITDLSAYLKSEDWEKDRPGTDQIKEVVEILQKTSLSLLPAQLPEWPEVEIGIARQPGPQQMGVYYDFFKFPGNTLGILYAEPDAHGVDAPMYAAALRSSVRTLIHEKKSFELLPFITSLHALLLEDPWKMRFSLGFLLLNSFKEQLAYVACGMPSAIHLPQGMNHPRFLTLNNQRLGNPTHPEFVETLDNWSIGDTLILHSLAPSSEHQEEFQAQMAHLVLDSALLSAERQADAILKKASAFSFVSLSGPKVVIALRRIS